MPEGGNGVVGGVGQALGVEVIGAEAALEVELGEGREPREEPQVLAPHQLQAGAVAQVEVAEPGEGTEGPQRLVGVPWLPSPA